MLVIIEIYFDKIVLDIVLNIDKMKLLRFDRKGRKGGGCVLYFVEYLYVIYCKDLFIEGFEVIWL